MAEARYIPALGHRGLTGVYDLAVRLATRESAWRRRLLDQVDPRAGEAVLDVGCGTGTFAIMCKQRSPGSRIMGIDPDPEALAIAAGKAKRAGVDVEWVRGFADDAARFEGGFDKAVSSLLFHQVPSDGKRSGIAAMLTAVSTGGSIHIADYCRQPDRLMRNLFRIIQRLDGHETTQPNLEGAIERLLAERAGMPVKPTSIIRTPTGAISLFKHTKREENAGERSRRLAPPVTGGRIGPR